MNSHGRFLVWLLAAYLFVSPSIGQPLDEVEDVTLDTSATLNWTATLNADDYSVYQASVGEFPTMPAECIGAGIVATSFATREPPDPGQGMLYLVGARSDAEGEGTLGMSTGGAPRETFGTCASVVSYQVLNRVGFGWSEWASDRINTLGVQNYIDEQLAPETIDDASNVELNDRLMYWTPVDDVYDPIYDRIDRAVYSRRQLLEVMVKFWANHFNTDLNKTVQYINALDPIDEEFAGAGRAHMEEQALYRADALDSSFRDILESSALNAAMLVYLDTVLNVALAPNENYARELLELHALGVAGGYTQLDVEELSRVFTGWSICKKTVPDEDDPLAPCQISLLPGLRWVKTFDPAQHDHGVKVLFAGTPQEVTIPDTSGNPSEGINDVTIALDAIANHPSTADFIARKLLVMMVTENPTPQMVQNVITEWNNTSGDLRDVLREVLAQGVADPQYARMKLKDGFEHAVSAYRGMRGLTNSLPCPDTPVECSVHRILSDAYFAGFQLLLYPVPTGHPEVGRDWIGTNGYLQRQNRNLNAATDIVNYGTDVVGLVNDNNLTTATEIVDFFAQTLLGNAVTASERTSLIQYLETDEQGLVSPYDDDRIRQTIGLMLGMAQFMEQ